MSNKSEKTPNQRYTEQISAQKVFTIYTIREVQIKTTVRHHYLMEWLNGMTKHKTDDTKCWQRCGVTGIHIHGRWEYKMVQPFGRELGSVMD
jgi:hypothetical protein